MARQSVPSTSSGDRKSSITDGDSLVRQTGSDDVDADRDWWSLFLEHTSSHSPVH